MLAVYPRAPDPVPDAPPFNEALCVEKIVELRETQLISKERAGGRLIHVVGGRTVDIHRVWDDIETERKALEAVPLDVESKYRTAVAKVTDLLDTDLWIAGMKAKMGGVLEPIPEPIGP